MAARDSQDIVLTITQTTQAFVRDSQDIPVSLQSPTTAQVRDSQDIPVSLQSPTTALIRNSQDLTLYLLKIFGCHDSQDLTLPVASPTTTLVRLSQDVSLYIVPTQEVPIITPCGSGQGFIPTADYYMNLLTSEYQISTKLKAWLNAVLQPFIQAGVIFGCMPIKYFDLDKAVGPQLDILGQIVGVNRTVNFQPSGGINPTLDDYTYRILLKAKIAQNQWDGQLDSLYTIWGQLFPGGVINVQDNQNMTASITLAGSFSSIIQDLITNGYIIPRPEAVEYNLFFATLPIFGFDQDNAYVAGFDLGHLA